MTAIRQRHAHIGRLPWSPEPADETWLPEVPDWVDDAACDPKHSDAWFPEKGATAEDAKAVCRRCPVRADCLEGALERQEQWGVWGGLSTRERRDLAAGRTAVAA